MPPIGTGAQGQAGIIKEASFGAGGTVDTYLELINENIKSNIEKLEAPYVFGSRNINKYYHGAHDIGGPFSIVVNPDNIGLLLYMALGAEANASQVLTSQAEVTEITCEADSSGSLSGEYITFNDPTTEYYAWFDVAGKGSADPALTGKTAIIVGIAENAVNTAVASALQSAVDAKADFGASVASEVVTITNANNGSVTDATNGDTGWSTAPNVTTQGSGGTAYDHVFTPAGMATDLDSFALEIERGIDCSIYSGCTVNNFTLSASKGSLVTADFEIVGKDETDGVSKQTLSPSTKQPYTFHMGSVEIDTTPVAYVNSFTITYGNNIDTDGGFVLNASNYRAHAYKTLGTLTGTLECEWTATSDALRDAYLDNTQVRVELIITSTETIESGYYYTLSIDIPKTHIMGDPPTIGGRDRIPFSVNFEGVYDSTNFIKITHRDALSTKWSA